MRSSRSGTSQYRSIVGMATIARRPSARQSTPIGRSPSAARRADSGRTCRANPSDMKNVTLAATDAAAYALDCASANSRPDRMTSTYCRSASSVIEIIGTHERRNSTPSLSATWPRPPPSRPAMTTWSAARVPRIDRGVPRNAPLTPIPATTSTTLRIRRPKASTTIDQPSAPYHCRPCSMPRWRQTSPHSAAEPTASAAAHVSLTLSRSPICSRNRTATTVTPATIIPRRRSHARYAAASCGPAPSRPTATSRATAAWKASPGTARIRKNETSRPRLP